MLGLSILAHINPAHARQDHVLTKVSLLNGVYLL